MEEKEENLNITYECKKICIRLKKIVINIYKKAGSIVREWYPTIAMLLAFTILAIVFLSHYYNYYEYIYANNEDKLKIVGSLGQVGDYLGGTLNPIFAFLSFCLLLITIKIQGKELNNSTKELAKSSQALTEQSKSLQLQNFENTFFNMINLHNEIIKNLSLEVKEKYREIGNNGESIYFYSILSKKVDLREEKSYSGKNAISQLFKILDTHIKNNIKEDSIKNNNLSKLYNEFHLEYDDILSHYFRNIYQILKFVNKQKILKDENKNHEFKNQKFYTNILRAQFSSIEFALLLMNALYKESGNKLFPLLVKFEFLEPFYIILKYSNSSKPNENYPKSKIFGSNKYFLDYIESISKDIE